MTWVALDSLMILMIFVLMTAILFGSDIKRVIYGKRLESEKREGRLQNSVVSFGNKGHNVAPVAYERDKAHQIAINMVINGVKRLPSRQALDIREVDRNYQVRFSLPRGVNEENLTVEINQNILTLLMESGRKTYMRRIRIPCDYASNSSLSHFVSNSVLFVEISKLSENHNKNQK